MGDAQNNLDEAQYSLDIAHEAYYMAKIGGMSKKALSQLLGALQQAQFVYNSAEFMVGQVWEDSK